MVETVRCTLKPSRALSGKVLAWSGVGVVFFPVLPGLGFMLEPTLHGQNWGAFWRDGQWFPAMLTTLISSTIGTLGALLLCLSVVLGLYPGVGWQRYMRKLPALLAIPHVAFAAGSLLLFSSTGWLARLMAASGWEALYDPYGVGLGLTLALKESWFLLWVVSAQLKQTDLQPQLLIMRSLGYGRLQSSWLVLLPQLLPSLGWAIVAVLAYNISVVDVAIILGPGNPPTLAVLTWQWLNDASPAIQAKGMIAALLLIALLAALSLAGYLLWRVWRSCLFPHSGQRYLASGTHALSWLADMMTLIGGMVLLILLVWSLASSWFYPALLPQRWSLVAWQLTDLTPLLTALMLGIATSLCALVMVVFWLEWGTPRYGFFLWLPLLLPALPLVIGQYGVLLRWGWDGTFIAVAWSHLLWMIPYMLLVLTPAYRQVEPRLLLSARSLGLPAWQVLLWVKWPSLLRPFLSAWAIGFSVSIAQYLPTLYAGAGRFVTVTTEAVALSSGGDPRTLAVQALLQFFLPAMVFLVAVLSGLLAGYYRQGLR
ncbi:ABC transporter permease [Serratia sp. DD3]|uniref:ABC transporter permease n=1 Tax=Serratia sp. DD3 TaxID=1410619 RepID=UPI0003C4E45A|nr:hypothetical protein [Serratia sp. DD3]KEY58452.1 inner membrane ABC transporter permease protein YnjC [Serratia sp. DD3]